MPRQQLKKDAPVRSVTDIAAGDYVKIGSQWQKVTGNSAAGVDHTPRDWTVTTERGSYGMFGVNRYAKAEDFEQ